MDIIFSHINVHILLSPKLVGENWVHIICGKYRASGFRKFGSGGTVVALIAVASRLRKLDRGQLTATVSV